MAVKILYSITGHGYGHATRSLAISREILRKYPNVEITYSTTVPREFLIRSGAKLAEAGRSLEDSSREYLRIQDYEPGTVEKNCFEVSGESTREVYRRFSAEHDLRISREADHLGPGGFCGVVSDIAAIPVAAAARIGIPSVCISNFTWDWILSPHFSGHPELNGFPDVLAADYCHAQAYLRLPFHPTVHPFQNVVDLPLVGRLSKLASPEIRRLLGIGALPGGYLVLVAVGGLKAGNWPKVQVKGCRNILFLVVGDLPVEFPSGRAIFLPDHLIQGLEFTDLVLAADAVVGKPGYGMCSECATNGTPMVGVERIGFAEYGPMKEGMGQFVPYRELRLTEFFSGEWEPALMDVLRAGRSPPRSDDGTSEAASRIGSVFGLKAS